MILKQLKKTILALSILGLALPVSTMNADADVAPLLAPGFLAGFLGNACTNSGKQRLINNGIALGTFASALALLVAVEALSDRNWPRDTIVSSRDTTTSFWLFTVVVNSFPYAIGAGLGTVSRIVYDAITKDSSAQRSTINDETSDLVLASINNRTNDLIDKDLP